MRRVVGLVSAVSAAAFLAWSGSVSAGAARLALSQIPLFPDTMTSAQWAQLPGSGWFNEQIDFAGATTVWTGNGAQGPNGAAARATLTYSFPADGTSWKLGAATAPNALGAALTGVYGASNIDQGREFIRQALAGYKRFGGLTLNESADDNSAYDSAIAHTGSRGDIRIGGIPVGTGANPIAASSAPVSGGDIAFNTSFFIPANLAAPANSYRYLRNAAGHEFGTALGLLNVVPCNGTKLMEGQVNTGFDGLQIDDVRGVQRAYGDRYAGNIDSNTPKVFGNLFAPVNRSVRESGLSTNGAAGPNGTKEDWYRIQFTLNFQPVVITVTPTGGSYLNGAESGGACTGSTSSVNAAQAGNLTVELLDTTGMPFTPAITATGGPGLPSVITRPSQAPGSYLLRVVDNGPNAAANQTVQSYDLSVVVANFKATPYANAGVNKRIESGVTSYFMGDINSAATEPGATITTYEWDLDGNGTFEIANNPRPTASYNADGVYTVTLRVTDSNGKQATDTITVTVFGSVTGMAWRNVPNATSPRTGTAPGTDIIAGAAWTSGGPWKTFDLVIEGRPNALVNAVNLGADGAPFGVTLTGTVFNHSSGSNVRSFGFETALAAMFFDTYACYGGTTNVDGGPTSFAGTTDLTGVTGSLKATSFTQPSAPLATDAAAPRGGSLRVLRVSVHGTLGGGASSVEIGLPGGLTRVFSIPTAVAVCPGDTDGDGDVDFIDLNRVLSAFGTSVGNPNYIAGADLDADGDVDFIDLNACLSFFGTSCAMGFLPEGPGQSVMLSEHIVSVGDVDAPFCSGDVDRDGRVTFADLNAALGAFGSAASSGVAPADLNGDGFVDTADLHEILNHFGQGL